MEGEKVVGLVEEEKEEKLIRIKTFLYSEIRNEVKKAKKVKKLKKALDIMTNLYYVSNHEKINESDYKKIINIVKKFLVVYNIKTLMRFLDIEQINFLFNVLCENDIKYNAKSSYIALTVLHDILVNSKAEELTELLSSEEVNFIYNLTLKIHEKIIF